MPRGGKREGSGRKIVDIQLDQESGRELALLIKAHGQPYTRAMCDAVVRALIHKAYQELDRQLLSDMDDVADIKG